MKKKDASSSSADSSEPGARLNSLRRKLPVGRQGQDQRPRRQLNFLFTGVRHHGSHALKTL
jgi:hypothetical protein